MAAQNSIDVTVDNDYYPSFTIDDVMYHITLKGNISHVTTQDRGKHYRFTTDQVSGIVKAVITSKKMQNGFPFDNLSEKVKNFIRENYDAIMKIKVNSTETISWYIQILLFVKDFIGLSNGFIQDNESTLLL